MLSLLVPPERLSAFLAAPAPARAEAVLDGLVRLYGERARVPGALLERAWGVDPFTRGYITSWQTFEEHEEAWTASIGGRVSSVRVSARASAAPSVVRPATAACNAPTT